MYQFKVFKFTLDHAPCHAVQDSLEFRLVPFFALLLVIVIVVSVTRTVHVPQPQPTVHGAAQQVGLQDRKRISKERILTNQMSINQCGENTRGSWRYTWSPWAVMQGSNFTGGSRSCSGS